jgi:hypothetical protein
MVEAVGEEGAVVDRPLCVAGRREVVGAAMQDAAFAVVDIGEGVVEEEDFIVEVEVVAGDTIRTIEV